MSIVKNLCLLKGLSSNDIQRIEHAASMHRKYSNIVFEIFESDGLLSVKVQQGKHISGNYAHASTLELRERVTASI